MRIHHVAEVEQSEPLPEQPQLPFAPSYFAAQFEGTCSVCSDRIYANDEIGREAKGYAHRECVERAEAGEVRVTQQVAARRSRT